MIVDEGEIRRKVVVKKKKKAIVKKRDKSSLLYRLMELSPRIYWYLWVMTVICAFSKHKLPSSGNEESPQGLEAGHLLSMQCAAWCL